MKVKLVYLWLPFISCQLFSMDEDKKTVNLIELSKKTDQLKNLEEKTKDLEEKSEQFEHLTSRLIQSKNETRQKQCCYYCCLTCCFPHLCDK